MPNVINIPNVIILVSYSLSSAVPICYDWFEASDAKSRSIPGGARRPQVQSYSEHDFLLSSVRALVLL